jgi:5-methylcytosine-specific restriction endonuclease McrBC regulatory subunit McrC
MRLILDAKYKDTGFASETADEIEVEIPGSRLIRIHRSDVYQAIAYGQHLSYGPAAVALVYPVVMEPGQQLPLPYRIIGFGQDLNIFFIDVGREAAKNIELFRKALLDTAGGASSLVTIAA